MSEDKPAPMSKVDEAKSVLKENGGSLGAGLGGRLTRISFTGGKFGDEGMAFLPALEDLREFKAEEFVEALFADGDSTVH